MIVTHAFHLYYANQYPQNQQAFAKPVDTPSPHTNSQTEPQPRPRRPSMVALGQGRLT